MESEKDKVLLIDIDSIIYYEAFKEKLEWAIQGIDERMQRIFKETGTNKYIAFLTEGKCFRYAKALSSDYKGSRKGKDKPKWFYVLKDYLKAEYGAISIDGLEADDCVAYFANNPLFYTMICSPDKDVLLQCPGTHYNYQMVGVKDSKVMFESKGFVETSEEEALNFLYLQMLMGDSTDGISGIEGMGPKKAEKYLSYMESEIGDTNSHILSAYINKYKPIEGISRFSETFKLVYLLKTDEDMIREIGTIPEIPKIQEYNVEQESMSDEDDSVDW